MLSIEVQNEKQLLDRLRNGDDNALSLLYKSHWQALFLSAYNILKDRRACEDIVQELFLQLWLKRETLDIRESLAAYLATAVRYQVFHHLRKSAKLRMLQPISEDDQDSGNTDDALLQNDLRRQVAEAVSGLPDKCRLIYKLSREEHLSHKEIAARLNISTKTVENQLTIALRRLRNHLANADLVHLSLLLFLFI